jgi:hypothetical protein
MKRKKKVPGKIIKKEAERNIHQDIVTNYPLDFMQLSKLAQNLLKI